ncbi:asparagine synthase (glutamine-hydrolyzing) [Candidatus Cardinium hertigii]|uniref:asparagine synthase (glutamine-hydrolyzing) n=1 Tax=Candidatus Cardinium hertigii TaxID=247481 RepID=UPI003D7D288F
MCGIAGIIALQGSSYVITTEALSKMNHALLHRGPDDQAIYCNDAQGIGFAFTRLSLLDAKNGMQPMQNLNGSIVLVYNGEIYDYESKKQSLQNKGIVFQSYTDTEVLLYLYQEYGIQILDQLNGEFAFALYDEREKCAIIARDRWGTKSLYYAIQHHTLFFASEMKALLALPNFYVSINLETIFYQMMRADSLKRTIFKDIYILEPQHYLIVQEGKFQTKRYGYLLNTYAINSPHTHQDDMFKASNKVAVLLKKSVQRRLWSDFETGVFLSGGLDSTILCAIMQACMNHPVHTFSLCFRNQAHDESNYSRYVANYLHTTHHPLWIEDTDLANHLPIALFHTECLAQTMDFVGKFLLAKHASNFVRVVLTGEGADEFFLGYPWFKTIKNKNDRWPYRGKVLQDFTEENEPTQKGYDLTISNQDGRDKLISQYGYYPISIGNIQEMENITKDIFSDDFIMAIHDKEPAIVYSENIPRNEILGISLIKKNQLEFLKTTFPLYVLQCLGGKVEMAHSLESRLPFLDLNLINYILTLPDHYHLFGMREKNLLKLAFQSMIPPLVYKRTKRGYTAPILSGFLNNPKRPLFFDHFIWSEATVKSYNLFSYKGIQRTLKYIENNNMDIQMRILLERKIMLVLCTHLLYDMFITNRPIKAPNYH